MTEAEPEARETGGAPRLTPKGQATRARILAAAADLILSCGVAGTGLEDVRRAAGVSGSQLTHYFHDKGTLIRDVVTWQAEHTLAMHRSAALGGLDTFQAWERWAQHIVVRMTERDFRGGCEFGSLAGQLVESAPEVRPDLAEGYERWHEVLSGGLRTMRERGELRPDADPHALAHALLAAMQGGMLLAQTLRRPDPLRDALAAALAHLRSFATDPC